MDRLHDKHAIVTAGSRASAKPSRGNWLAKGRLDRGAEQGDLSDGAGVRRDNTIIPLAPMSQKSRWTVGRRAAQQLAACTSSLTASSQGLDHRDGRSNRHRRGFAGDFT